MKTLLYQFLLLAVVLAGCGQRLSTVPGGGVVTFGGEYVAGANVAFLRDGQQGPAAIALTDKEGRFSLKTGKQPGVVPGNYKVTVQKNTSSSFQIPDPLPNSMTRSDYIRANNLVAQPMLPIIYSRVDQTPLKVEVKSDSADNWFTLELEGVVPSPPAPP